MNPDGTGFEAEVASRGGASKAKVAQVRIAAPGRAAVAVADQPRAAARSPRKVEETRAAVTEHPTGVVSGARGGGGGLGDGPVAAGGSETEERPVPEEGRLGADAAAEADEERLAVEAAAKAEKERLAAEAAVKVDEEERRRRRRREKRQNQRKKKRKEAARLQRDGPVAAGGSATEVRPVPGG